MLKWKLERLKKRMSRDISLEYSHTPDIVEHVVGAYIDRIKAMFSVEQDWFGKCEWTRVLSGKDAPEKNLKIMLTDAVVAVEKDLEVSQYVLKHSGR